ncbi:MAG TPA: 30S ribosomal protein S8 [Methylococcaceae bacterium]|jgi:small subunit ribosomal protein S8|nr:30S ribosomal protein S8 [Methylococcaceae bacterium]
MSITDPLADLLTRIRNGQSANKPTVSMPSSKLKVSVCRVLKQEGYIEDFAVKESENNKSVLDVSLKYYQGQPVIESIQRVSKPGRRVYKGADDLPKVLGGFGVAIISTSSGLMTDKEAREGGHGGEVLCTVS